MKLRLGGRDIMEMSKTLPLRREPAAGDMVKSDVALKLFDKRWNAFQDVSFLMDKYDDPELAKP